MEQLNQATSTQQLEIPFDASAKVRRNIANTNRRKRARWWFDQMRRVVDTAMEWNTAPRARPQQVYLTLANGRGVR